VRLSSALLVLLCACDRAPRAPEPTRARAELRAPARPSLEYVERVTGGAAQNARLPLVVAIHGLGDTPESFIELFEDFPLPVRVIAPRAPTPYSSGFAWMTTRVRDGREADLVREIDASTERLVALIERLRRRPDVEGLPLLTGFSQGGMLTYSITLARPDLVRAAFPIAGMVVHSRIAAIERCAQDAPKIHALHGEADVVVPFSADQTLVERLRAQGCDVTFQTFPGLRHLLTFEVRAALYDALGRALTPTH
jgi:phospholipase/carboxylesterase